MTANSETGFRIFSYPNQWLLLLCLVFTTLFSPTFTAFCSSAPNAKPFDFEAIQQQIKNISYKIKNASLSRQDIEDSLKQTEGFLLTAEDCASTSSSQIDRLDNEIRSLGPASDHEPGETAKERRRLTHKKQTLAVRLSECRLISTLAQRLKNDLTDQVKLHRKADFFSKTDNYYNNLLTSLPSYIQFKSQLTRYFATRSGLGAMTLPELIIFLLLSAGGGVAGWKLFAFLKKHLPSLRGWPETVAAFAAASGGLYIFYICRESLLTSYAPWLLLSLALYCFSMFLFQFFSSLGQSDFLSVAGIPPIRRIRLLVVLCVLLFVSTRMNMEGFAELHASLALIQFILICAVCLAGWSFMWSLNLPSGFIKCRGALRATITLCFCLALIVEVSGYRNLSIFLIIGLFSTYLLSILLKVTLLAIDETIGGFFLGKFLWQQKVRSAFGISKDESLMSILWLGFIFKLLAWFTAFFLLLQAWGLSSDQRNKISTYLVNGLHVGDLVIAPARILMGIFVFACCWTFVSWIKLRLDKKWLQDSHVSRSVQETLVTSTGYAGFALALLIGLSIAGVSFSNLAVIAGALSVGIGFGLQNIVNNFVSGLIILFERPVKRGDWISVGNTEGYVQKISVRSTLIQTFDRSDVIVPNSELISNQVTNMMLHDRYGRLIIPIGVAYGSDTELVRTILLDIAKANDKVINDGRAPKPHVLFLEFGDSSLNFELRCYLANIDERLVVKSEINYEIDKKFREHNISIPFPQRDLYIKEMPSHRSTRQEDE
jgi:small-conductance mechanosensitive channel